MIYFSELYKIGRKNLRIIAKMNGYIQRTFWQPKSIDRKGKFNKFRKSLFSFSNLCKAVFLYFLIFFYKCNHGSIALPKSKFQTEKSKLFVEFKVLNERPVMNLYRNGKKTQYQVDFNSLRYLLDAQRFANIEISYNDKKLSVVTNQSLDALKFAEKIKVIINYHFEPNDDYTSKTFDMAIEDQLMNIFEELIKKIKDTYNLTEENLIIFEKINGIEVKNNLFDLFYHEIFNAMLSDSPKINFHIRVALAVEIIDLDNFSKVSGKFSVDSANMNDFFQKLKWKINNNSQVIIKINRFGAISNSTHNLTYQFEVSKLLPAYFKIDNQYVLYHIPKSYNIKNLNIIKRHGYKYEIISVAAGRIDNKNFFPIYERKFNDVKEQTILKFLSHAPNEWLPTLMLQTERIFTLALEYIEDNKTIEFCTKKEESQSCLQFTHSTFGETYLSNLLDECIKIVSSKITTKKPFLVLQKLNDKLVWHISNNIKLKEIAEEYNFSITKIQSIGFGFSDKKMIKIIFLNEFIEWTNPYETFKSFFDKNIKNVLNNITPKMAYYIKGHEITTEIDVDISYKTIENLKLDDILKIYSDLRIKPYGPKLDGATLASWDRSIEAKIKLYNYKNEQMPWKDYFKRKKNESITHWLRRLFPIKINDAENFACIINPGGDSVRKIDISMFYNNKYEKEYILIQYLPFHTKENIKLNPFYLVINTPHEKYFVNPKSPLNSVLSIISDTEPYKKLFQNGEPPTIRYKAPFDTQGNIIDNKMTFKDIPYGSTMFIEPPKTTINVLNPDGKLNNVISTKLGGSDKPIDEIIMKLREKNTISGYGYMICSNNSKPLSIFTTYVPKTELVIELTPMVNKEQWTSSNKMVLIYCHMEGHYLMNYNEMTIAEFLKSSKYPCKTIDKNSARCFASYYEKNFEKISKDTFLKDVPGNLLYIMEGASFLINGKNKIKLNQEELDNLIENIKNNAPNENMSYKAYFLDRNRVPHAFTKGVNDFPNGEIFIFYLPTGKSIPDGGKVSIDDPWAFVMTPDKVEVIPSKVFGKPLHEVLNNLKSSDKEVIDQVEIILPNGVNYFSDINEIKSFYSLPHGTTIRIIPPSTNKANLNIYGKGLLQGDSLGDLVETALLEDTSKRSILLYNGHLVTNKKMLNLGKSGIFELHTLVGSTEDNGSKLGFSHNISTKQSKNNNSPTSYAPFTHAVKDNHNLTILKIPKQAGHWSKASEGNVFIINTQVPEDIGKWVNIGNKWHMWYPTNKDDINFYSNPEGHIVYIPQSYNILKPQWEKNSDGKFYFVTHNFPEIDGQWEKGIWKPNGNNVIPGIWTKGDKNEYRFTFTGYKKTKSPKTNVEFDNKELNMGSLIYDKIPYIIFQGDEKVYAINEKYKYKTLRDIIKDINEEINLKNVLAVSLNNFENPKTLNFNTVKGSELPHNMILILKKPYVRLNKDYHILPKCQGILEKAEDSCTWFHMKNCELDKAYYILNVQEDITNGRKSADCYFPFSNTNPSSKYIYNIISIKSNPKTKVLTSMEPYIIFNNLGKLVFNQESVPLTVHRKNMRYIDGYLYGLNSADEITIIKPEQYVPPNLNVYEMNPPVVILIGPEINEGQPPQVGIWQLEPGQTAIDLIEEQLKNFVLNPGKLYYLAYLNSRNHPYFLVRGKILLNSLIQTFCILDFGLSKSPSFFVNLNPTGLQFMLSDGSKVNIENISRVANLNELFKTMPNIFKGEKLDELVFYMYDKKKNPVFLNLRTPIIDIVEGGIIFLQKKPKLKLTTDNPDLLSLVNIFETKEINDPNEINNFLRDVKKKISNTEKSYTFEMTTPDLKQRVYTEKTVLLYYDFYNIKITTYNDGKGKVYFDHDGHWLKFSFPNCGKKSTIYELRQEEGIITFKNLIDGVIIPCDKSVSDEFIIFYLSPINLESEKKRLRNLNISLAMFLPGTEFFFLKPPNIILENTSGTKKMDSFSNVISTTDNVYDWVKTLNLQDLSLKKDEDYFLALVLPDNTHVPLYGINLELLYKITNPVIRIYPIPGKEGKGKFDPSYKAILICWPSYLTCKVIAEEEKNLTLKDYLKKHNTELKEVLNSLNMWYNVKIASKTFLISRNDSLKKIIPGSVIVGKNLKKAVVYNLVDDTHVQINIEPSMNLKEHFDKFSKKPKHVNYVYALADPVSKKLINLPSDIFSYPQDIFEIKMIPVYGSSPTGKCYTKPLIFLSFPSGELVAFDRSSDKTIEYIIQAHIVESDNWKCDPNYTYQLIAKTNWNSNFLITETVYKGTPINKLYYNDNLELIFYLPVNKNIAKEGYIVPLKHPQFHPPETRIPLYSHDHTYIYVPKSQRINSSEYMIHWIRRIIKNDSKYINRKKDYIVRIYSKGMLSINSFGHFGDFREAFEHDPNIVIQLEELQKIGSGNIIDSITLIPVLILGKDTFSVTTISPGRKETMEQCFLNILKNNMDEIVIKGYSYRVVGVTNKSYEPLKWNEWKNNPLYKFPLIYNKVLLMKSIKLDDINSELKIVEDFSAIQIPYNLDAKLIGAGVEKIDVMFLIPYTQHPAVIKLSKETLIKTVKEYAAAFYNLRQNYIFINKITTGGQHVVIDRKENNLLKKTILDILKSNEVQDNEQIAFMFELSNKYKGPTIIDFGRKLISAEKVLMNLKPDSLTIDVLTGYAEWYMAKKKIKNKPYKIMLIQDQIEVQLEDHLLNTKYNKLVPVGMIRIRFIKNSELRKSHKTTVGNLKKKINITKNSFLRLKFKIKHTKIVD